MKRIIRLTESDLARIVRRVIKEGGEYFDETSEWNSKVATNHPHLKLSGEGSIDWNDGIGSGKLNLETPYNGKGAVYFKCNSPVAYWKDNTPIFDKTSQKTDYDNSYNIIKQYCDQGRKMWKENEALNKGRY